MCCKLAGPSLALRYTGDDFGIHGIYDARGNSTKRGGFREPENTYRRNGPNRNRPEFRGYYFYRYRSVSAFSLRSEFSSGDVSRVGEVVFGVVVYGVGFL